MIIDKQIIARLREEYGDAFYLLDSEQFLSNYHELMAAFREVYPNFNIAYSYKTNYIPKLCRLVNEAGGYAEVVSEIELEIAKRVGCKPARIIWNGPVKNPVVMEEFLCEGGTVNIDSLEELKMMRGIVTRHSDKVLNIGIRCNYDVHDGVVSRFGFDVEGEDFRKAIEFVRMTDNVKLINFQCHFAKRQLEYWPTRAKGMIEMMERIGLISERIDIGGGMFGKMTDSLKVQLGSHIPDYKEYAQAAAQVFADYFKDKEAKPELIIEPGSALVGDCMKFVATVKTIKDIRGKKIATVMGSQNNISMSGVNPPMEVVAMGGEQREYRDMDFAGYTCIEGDILYRSFTGKVAVGDVIVISNCGSYSLVMKPPFILPNFPVLDICGTETEIIKRGETFDDMLRTFEF